ncbi:hypothetical protein BSKO_10474 [Bryopsis sp. KO-2023]|nr:hypothetical protein BSKO_10474 [Bryopsis sp. KO-2023]
MTSSAEKRQGLGLVLADISWHGSKDDSKKYSDPVFEALEGFLKTRPKISDDEAKKQKAAEAKAKLEKEKAAERAAAERAAAKAKAEKEKAAAEAKAKADKEKAAAEAKAKAERERKEREKRDRERMRQQAFLGGSAVGLGWFAFAKWNAVVPLFDSLFRAIGGPTLVSTLLRTPGYIVGRRVHLIEWNVERSPNLPDGPVMTIRLRTQSPEGLKAAIKKSYGLTGRNRVRQMSHWITFGPGFFEPIDQASDFNCLPDPVWVVWSKERGIGPNTIPFRSDENAKKKPAAGSIEEMSSLVTLIHKVAKLSRQSDQLPSQTSESADFELSDSPWSPSSGGSPHPFAEEASLNPWNNQDVVERVMEDALFSGSKISQGEEGTVGDLDGELALELGEQSNFEDANSDVMDRLLDDIRPDERVSTEHQELTSSTGPPHSAAERSLTGLDHGDNASGVTSSASSRGGVANGADDPSPREGVVSEKQPQRRKGFNLRPVKKSFIKFRDSILQLGRWGNDSRTGKLSAGSVSSTDDSEKSGSRGFGLDDVVVTELPPDFEAISEKEEIDLVLMAAERDARFMELFRVFVLKDEDIWSFFMFARELTRRSRI